MPYKDEDKQNKANHESYLRNLEKYRERNRINRKEIKEWFADVTKNDSCKFCGESCIVCLDYHHINPKGKVANVSKLVSDMRKKEMILAELAKCDCVCSNCHRKHEAGLI